MLSSFRPWLLRRVLESTTAVVAVQRFFDVYPVLGARSSLVAAIFHVGAALGNEILFILFLPALFWEFDAAVARAIIIVWLASYYVVHVVKDTLQLPRPPAFKACPAHVKAIEEWKIKSGRSFEDFKNTLLPQLDNCKGGCVQGTHKMEKLYEHEYGFPSSHTHNAFSMPLMLLVGSWSRYAEGQSRVWLASAMLTWTVLCPLSRLVLGVHSIPDVVGGMLFGLSFLAMGVFFVPQVDAFVLSAPTYIFAPLAIILMLLAIAAYPRPAKPAWVPTPGDTTIIIAVTCGVTIAANVLRESHKARLESPIYLPWNEANKDSNMLFVVLAMLGRLVFGFGVLFATRAIGKALCLAILPRIVPASYADADDASVQDESGPKSSPTSDAAKLKPSSSGFGLDGNSNEDSDPKPKPKPEAGSSSSGLRKRGTAPASAADAPASRSSRSDPREPEPSPRSGDGDVPSVLPAAASSPPSVSPSDAKERKADKLRIRVPDKKNYWVELTTKAVTYTAIGFNAVFTVPMVFELLGWRNYGIGVGGSGR